jgi:RNA polymerase sigma factor (sigma-70 family)
LHAEPVRQTLRRYRDSDGRSEEVANVVAGHLAGCTLPGPSGLPEPDPRHRYEAEFIEFFRKEYREIVKFVQYTGTAFDDADDAVSEAMAQAYPHWPMLTHPARWVRTAALHLAIKKAERDRRRQSTEEKAARLDGQDRLCPQRHCEPDEHARVVTALRCLPPAQLEVMALTFDGYPPAEIAELLHQPAANVRSNLRHARDRLRRELETPPSPGRGTDDTKET